MNIASVLTKEKIVSLSELQRNPGKALSGAIVRIVKNGKELGIYMSKEEFEDFAEEQLSIKKEAKKELKKAIKEASEGKLMALKDIL